MELLLHIDMQLGMLNMTVKVAQEFERQKTHLKSLFAVELLNGILLHRENASLKLNIPVRKILYCKQMNM